MSSLYTEIIQDAWRNPRHKGELAQATHRYEDENPLCGDMLSIELRIEDSRIVEARFQGRGCAISQAAAELILERVEGQPVCVVESLDNDGVLGELGLPNISPARLKCALLSLWVLRGAVHARSCFSG